ncbi:MAG: TIGR02679 family protein [Acidimicrobiia bacterium]
MTPLAPDFARLDRPGLEPLWDELARRYGEGTEPVTVSLRGLSLPQRRALADLLGSDRLPAAQCKVPVRRLVDALGVDGANDVRVLVERVRGPIPDRRAVRAADRLERERLWTWLAEEAGRLAILEGRSDGVEGAPASLRWTAMVRAEGVPRGDLAAHRQRLSGILAALAALPADGIALPALADDALGDPHALDRGRTAAALALGALATARGRDRPTDAEGIRALWEEVGVVPDPLSSTVLALGLGGPGRGPLDAWLRGAAAAGEPVALTLAQLRRWPLAALPASTVVYVVENPSLLTEAASRRWSGPPIVCSSGRPTLATVLLLRQLGTQGATLVQHADFDVAGLGITSWLAERVGTRPWRMSERHYRAALAVSRPRRPIVGVVPPTPWDPALQGTMAGAGVAVFEEELRRELLDAMARSMVTDWNHRGRPP